MFAFATARSVSGPGLAYVGFTVLTLGGAAAVWSTHEANEASSDEPVEDFRAADLWAGFGYALLDHRRRLLVALAGSGMLMLGVVEAIVIVLAIDILHTGDAGVGFLTAVLGIGSIVGASIAMVAGQRARLFPAMRAGLIATGIPLAAIAAAPVAAAPMLAISGAGMQLTDVCARTMLQRVVPDDKLGRVFGVLESLYVGLEGLGAFVASLLVVRVGPRWGLLLASLLLPVSGFLLRNRLASLDVGVRAPAEEMARLRATDLFAPLPPQALERVATRLVPLDVPVGTIVIREGEPGSRFYVLAEGRAIVSRNRETIAECGPGDYFGEVALLLDQPRNATVTAMSDLRVFVLERDEFMRVLTGQAAVDMKAESRGGAGRGRRTGELS